MKAKATALVPFVRCGPDFDPALDLPSKYPGVRTKAPTDYTWGREVHLIDPGGVCWHIRKGQ